MENSNSKFAVVEFGGPIGRFQSQTMLYVSGHGAGIVMETYDTKIEAKERTKFWNKSRTHAEKKYYGYKYKTVEIKPEATQTPETTNDI